MSKKQERKEKKKERSALNQLVVTIYDDETIKVDGPINDFMWFRKIMNAAEKSVIDHHDAMKEEKEGGKLIRLN